MAEQVEAITTTDDPTGSGLDPKALHILCESVLNGSNATVPGWGSTRGVENSWHQNRLRACYAFRLSLGRGWMRRTRLTLRKSFWCGRSKPGTQAEIEQELGTWRHRPGNWRLGCKRNGRNPELTFSCKGWQLELVFGHDGLSARIDGTHHTPTYAIKLLSENLPPDFVVFINNTFGGNKK